MSELADARARLALNEAKINVLKQCATRIERDLLRFAVGLARDGYGKDEILQAIEAQRPNFDEAVKAALRSITIMDLLASAQDG
jgi:hypothetical protein